MRNSYDLNGNRIGFEDPNGNFYSYEFDELNHLSKIIDPLLNERSYEYDESENLEFYLENFFFACRIINCKFIDLESGAHPLNTLL